jgi:hypothetical protein
LAEVHGNSELIPKEEVILTSPLTNISKIIGIGLNYKDGAAEMVRRPNIILINCLSSRALIQDAHCNENPLYVFLSWE